MRRLAVALLIAQVAVVHAELVQTDVAGELMSSARLWTGKKRDDLAMLALQKLLRINPDQVDALLMLGEIELRLDHVEQAQKLIQQLQIAHPEHPAAQQLAQAYRIATSERKTMAMIRLLARSGKDQEAAAMMRQLFPLGNPGGELGREYVRIVGQGSIAKTLSLQQSTKQAAVTSNASRFWDLMAAANAALEQKQFAKAEKLARSANRLFRNDPEVSLTRASIYLEMGETRKAEKLYVRTLAAKPAEDRALRGLIKLWLAQGKRRQALAFVEDFVDQHPESAEGFAQPWAGLLREEADELLAKAETEQAQRMLQTGLSRMPTQVWLRYDLASLYKRQGFADIGRRIMNEGVELVPGDAEMAYANGVYLSSLGDEEGALASLHSMAPEKFSDGMKALARKAEVRLRIKRAHADFLAGKQQAVVIWLDEAEYRGQDDDPLSWEVAQGWIDNGEVERGLALGQRLRRPGAVETSLRYAGLLSDSQRDQALTELFAEIPAATITSDQQRQTLLDLRRRNLLRRAAVLAAQKRWPEARQLLEQGMSGDLQDDAKLLMAVADYQEDSGDLPAASATYRRVVERNPADYEARLALARTRIRLNDPDSEAIMAELRQLDSLVPQDQTNLRLGIARQFSALSEHDDARRIAQTSGNAHLDNADVQMQVGRIEKSAERYEWALNRFDRARQIALEKPDDDIKPKQAEEAIASIKQRRYGFATGGFDQRQLSGTSGISQVSNDEYPLLIRQPYGYQGHFFTQIDYSTITAGNLNLRDYDTAGLFGKIQAFGRDNMSGAVNQTASGVDFGVGYESDDWRFDLGTSPQGFPVSYLVGGIKKTGNIGDGYYMLDISRRPKTNSLLSYAGAHDPVTGEVWGGVRKNGAEFYGGYDINRLGLFLQGSGHYLDGEKVKSNTTIMGRTGADWSWINDTDMRLTTGFALMYMANGNDQQYYTFGHGGYWSPQDYKSISFPVQWTGRFHKLSYLLRGSGSYSMSRQDGADFYPTNKQLQLSAASQPLPAGYDSPVYGASSSTAFGYQLTGMLEYQVQDQWYLGARMELARSPYYAPNFMTFYFRYDFEPSNKPIPFPPRPVKPYDRY